MTPTSRSIPAPEFTGPSPEIQCRVVLRFVPRIRGVLVGVGLDRAFSVGEVVDRGIVWFHLQRRPQDTIFGGEDGSARRAVGRVVT